MGDPQVPGGTGESIELPCGRRVQVDAFDMGMREYGCACGDAHAVVMDVHPLGRWIPESIVAVLESTVEPADEYDTFGTIHLMGMVLEEFPGDVVVRETSEDHSVGWALLWVTAFEARRLHEIVVELLVELMDHAVSHSDDPAIEREFADQLETFDVTAFVETYREQREFETAGDSPVG